MKEIKENSIEAQKVIFLQPIFEDDFPERGMKAWLTKIDRDKECGCYKLYFDFTDFEAENDKYLIEAYYENRYVREKILKGELKTKELYTAKEADMYSNKYSVYFGDLDEKSHGAFEDQIVDYLMAID